LPGADDRVALASAAGRAYGAVISIAGNMPMVSEITPLLSSPVAQYDYLSDGTGGGHAGDLFVLLLIINLRQCGVAAAAHNMKEMQSALPCPMPAGARRARAIQRPAWCAGPGSGTRRF